MNDLCSSALEVLLAHGLMLDAVDADGALHYCGTTDRPHSKNGRYILHADEWPTLWWQNHNTGESESRKLYDTTKLSAKDRKVEKAAMEQRRAAREAEQAARWAQAAQRAKALYAKARPADDDVPYLSHKGVHAADGLRVFGSGGHASLVVPVRDADGGIISLQFIQPDGAKRFLSGGKQAGGYFPIPARDGGKDGPLLIAEGIATALSLHECTGHTVLTAFNCGNLLPVAKLARKLYPSRELVLCADNDLNNKKQDGSPFNAGKDAAEKAVRAVGGVLALCPSLEGANTDFNDLHTKTSAERVRQEVEAARKAADACPMPEGFYLVPEGKRNAGLYWLNTKADGNTDEVRIGPPLMVRGLTRTPDGDDWGVMLEWKDPDDRPHRWAMPFDILPKQGGEWFGVLVSGGWLGVPAMRGKLSTFLSAVRPARRIRCVPRVGWYDGSFVLPDTVYGASAGSVVLQSAVTDNPYKMGGTAEDWRELAALATGNSRMEFALYVALAGPFLHIAGLESGGFNLVGCSSIGKSTALRLAASVWGSPAYVRSWRTTDNALEGMAALHNDTLLILDEIGQAPARVVSEAAYMLSNGMGKARANKEGNTRKSHSWRLMFLSSGEAGLAERLAEIGQRVKAGQEVRLVDIPMDAGKGLRGFDVLNGLPSAAALSMRVQELAAANYGHAGRALVQALAADDGSLAAGLMAELNSIVSEMCPPDADGQVRRVAMRFALCMVAGEYAMNAGILPDTFTPDATMKRLFEEWLASRGGAGASEDAAILSAVRFFIEAHGASRFEDADAEAEQRVINRVGYRRKNGGNTEFLILPESFKYEVLKGYQVKRACRVLADAGWLYQGSKGRYVSKPSVRGVQTSCYVITPHDGGEND